MKYQARLFWLFCVPLVNGCPLDEDPLAKDPAMDVAPSNSEDDQHSQKPAEHEDRTTKPDAPTNAADASASSSVDGGATTEVVDAGGNGGENDLDAGATLDASSDNDAGADLDAAVADGGVYEGPDLGPPTMDDVARAALIASYITAQDIDNNWYPLLQSSTVRRALLVTPSHGAAVQVFQNPLGYDAVTAWQMANLEEALVMPPGTVVAKKTYTLDATTKEYVYASTLVMAKVNGLDRTSYEGGWFYMKITDAAAPARSTTCVGCHNGRSAKNVWPADPEVVGSTAGKPDALIPYDYLWVPYCYDPKTPECLEPPV